MALNINGNFVQIDIKHPESKNNLLVQSMKLLAKDQPFKLISKSILPVFVIPTLMIIYDHENSNITKCDNVGQFQWILQCAMIMYEQAEPIFEDECPKIIMPYLLPETKKLLEL